MNDKNSGSEKLVINYYIRCIYIVLFVIVFNIFYQTNNILWIYDYFKENLISSYAFLINVIALYFILFKLKFIITFSISYD